MSKKSNYSFSKFIEIIKKNKLISYIIAVFIALLLSLLIFNNSSSNKTTTKETNNLEYVENLENRLSEILSCVQDAGRVKVIITVESGMENILATKVSIDQDGAVIEKKEEPITVNGKTVIIKENYPKITGVLIVAEGANNIWVKSKLLNATTSLLGVDVNNIEVLTMK